MSNSRFAPVAALFATDAYKLGHIQQYELAGQGLVSAVYSNYTNRRSMDPAFSHVVHFGLQAFITKNLMADFEPFFAADEDEVAALYEERVTAILGPNTIGSEHIRALHRLGYLPLRFRAVPEGTLVPIRVPSFTVENTLPEFYWLTNYIETALSAGVWHPSTVATIAHGYRTILEECAARTGGAPGAVDFQAHDFSYRGQTCDQAAAASGAAHLLSFSGTDSLVSLDWIDEYYDGEHGGFVAASVPATEHSVMCAGIATVGEREMFSRLLDLYPTGIVSVVSDTFDLWNVLTTILPELHDKVLGRDGKLVIRPDSGNPVDILTGNPTAPAGSPAHKGVIELLWDEFGGTTNVAGFRELDCHIGAIYGDSITRDRARDISERLAQKGFASTNVVFGVGSFSYQYLTRDTFGSAMKATWAQVDGHGFDLSKDPVTDSGTKKSATGRLAVVRDGDGELNLIEKATPEQEAASELQTMWQDGHFVRHQSFADVRRVLSEQSTRADSAVGATR